ncbi:spermatogenesis- and oogenesis-specific basic helix-loop-helix-containing protein 1 isoform X1 [Lates japonicus]
MDCQCLRCLQDLVYSLCGGFGLCFPQCLWFSVSSVTQMEREEEDGMNFTETRTRPAPGPHTESDPGPVDQTLLTIDSEALIVSPEREEEGEEDDYEGVKQPKMKPHQSLKSSCCVFLERHRRKRITQSCSKLRQLLPTIHGGHVDMVTVLETTVAFLETVQELVRAEHPELKLCPPAELHADWMLQSGEQGGRTEDGRRAPEQVRQIT